MGTALISRSCINCCQCKESVVEPKELSPRSQSCVPACRKLDGVAAWLLNGVAAVFFSSLERCSCIYIETKDDSEDLDYLPLISYDGYEKRAAGIGKGTVGDFIDNEAVVKYT